MDEMMDSSLFSKVYNPDVLTCLANLSNDEVFTPPEVVNQMLDMLPQELFENPDTTFLDPACKTGVFLREIAKRLIKGLEPQIPDLQDRVDHIFRKQLYGIAITDMTALLSRRSVYCSQNPAGEYSVTKFDSFEGNIRFRNLKHTWKNGRCIYCGVSQKEGTYEREEMEVHAYEWIHTYKPEDIFNMKFDVIISNPPYQLSTGGGQAQATPIYNMFVEQAKKLNPKYLTMIIPSRWFSGGIGLKEFRQNMMSDRRLRSIVDYVNAKECFPGCSIGGGVSYFLWEKDYNGSCEITNINGNKKVASKRYLDEFPIVVRNNNAVSIIHKASNDVNMENFVSAISPFALPTYTRGEKEKDLAHPIVLHSSAGIGYIGDNEISQGKDYLQCYKVLLSANTSEHAGEPRKDGTFKVFSTMKLLSPKEACTHSYILIGPCENETHAKNLMTYLRTKFVRFLVLQSVAGISISKDKFRFVPKVDFSKSWSDDELYEKYNLSSEEIEYIETLIAPFEFDGGEDDA